MLASRREDKIYLGRFNSIQTFRHIDFADMVKTCSRYRGYQCGAEYAEGFRQCQVYLKGTTKRLLP